MPNDAAVLLVHAGQEARNVDERHQGDVEGVAEAHEAGALDRGVDVQATCASCVSLNYSYLKRVNRKLPAACLGLLPTMPTVLPFMRPKPVTMFFAKRGMISKKSRSSTTPKFTSFQNH